MYIEQARYGEARELTEPAVERVRDLRDPILEACTLEIFAECYFWCGDLQKARPYLERTVTICEATPPGALIRTAGLDLWIMAAGLITTDVLLGWPGRAMEMRKLMLTRAESSAHPFSRLLGIVLADWIVHQLRGDLSFDYAKVSRDCEEHGLYEVAGWACQSSGWCDFWRGERTQGIAKTTESMEKLNAVNSFLWLPWRLIVLGEMKAEIGETEAAETVVEQALESANLSRERWCLPEVYRVAAKVALCKSPGNPNLAETHLRHAIELARNQGTKLWELRATTSLARLLRDTDRRYEARTSLAEIYNWFTEGFDTADLKDARARLDELAS